MWLSLVMRFWKLLAGALVILAAGWFLHHRGYESGFAASEAKWQPLFAAAEKARDVANEKARRKEEDSIQLAQMAEAEHAKTVASLNLRAADAERSNLSLVRQLAARSRCGGLPKASGPTAIPDDATAGGERLAGAAGRFTDLARRCESDARQLAELQEWVTGQLGILRAAR